MGISRVKLLCRLFTPFHPAIQCARRHDFLAFYEQEVEFRKELSYPPFSRIALLTAKGRNEEKVDFAANHLKRELEEALKELPDLIMAGPAPAPLVKAESFYRYQIMLRTQRMTVLSKRLAEVLQRVKLPDDCDFQRGYRSSRFVLIAGEKRPLRSEVFWSFSILPCVDGRTARCPPRQEMRPTGRITALSSTPLDDK